MCKYCGDPTCTAEQLFDEAFAKGITSLAVAAQMVEADLASGELSFDTLNEYGQGKTSPVRAVVSYGMKMMKELANPMPNLPPEIRQLGEILGLDFSNPELVKALDAAGTDADKFNEVIDQYTSKPSFTPLDAIKPEDTKH